MYEYRIKKIKAKIAELNNLKRYSKTNDFRILACGQYNHGKSTLLNQLLGDYSNQTFKTSVLIETKKIQEISKGNIIYIDTPGLSVDINDNKKTLNALKRADLHLFLHKINLGELDACEVDFLKHVASQLNARIFLKNTIFVLSASNKKNSEEIKKIKLKIQEQLSNIFKQEAEKAMLIDVDSISFNRGMLENKNILVENSNIDKLKAEIRKKEMMRNL